MINKIKKYLSDEIESSNEVIKEYTSGSRPKEKGWDDFIEGNLDLAQRLLLQIEGCTKYLITMEEDLKIIDEVIASLYDDYEQEQPYAQKVIGAWSRINDKLGR